MAAVRGPGGMSVDAMEVKLLITNYLTQYSEGEAHSGGAKPIQG